MAVGRLPDAPLKDAEKTNTDRVDGNASTVQNLLQQNGQRTFSSEPTVEDAYENTNGVASAVGTNEYGNLAARAAADAEAESLRQLLPQDDEEENADPLLSAAEEM